MTWIIICVLVAIFELSVLGYVILSELHTIKKEQACASIWIRNVASLVDRLRVTISVCEDQERIAGCAKTKRTKPKSKPRRRRDGSLA